MSFVLTDDQRTLRDAAMTFMAREAPLSRLRKLRDSGHNGKDQSLRVKLAEHGFFAAIVAEEIGDETDDESVGESVQQSTAEHFGMVGMGQLLEAQGRQLAATPLLQTALIGASAIELAGSKLQQASWLPKIAAGEMTLAFAIDESAHHNPANIACRIAANGSGFKLNGDKISVPDGHHADFLMVLCESDAGLSLVLVPTVGSSGLRIQELVTLDSHGAARINMTDVDVPADHVIGGPGAARKVLQPLLDRACAGLAAETLGGAQAAFEITREYLLQRSQFDQILASFQVIQHRLAQMFIELELNQSLVLAALVALDKQQDNASELCSMAKASTSELVHHISNECIQLHGGTGMTDAADAGLFVKRARVQQAMFGSASFHRDRIATLHGF